MKRAMAVSVGILLAMATAASAVTVEWNIVGAGSWNVAANWNPAAVPTSADDVLLGTKITAARTLTLDANWIINSLTCSGTFVYTLDRGGSTSRTLQINTGNISVNATGANLAPTGSPAYVSIVMPDSLSATWNIGGPTFVGNVNGSTSTGTTITKTGSGTLTWGGSGNYAGALTVNAGGLWITGNPTGLGAVTVNEGTLRVNGVPTGMGNLLVNPTLSGDATLDGTGTLGLAASKTASFLGTGSGKAVVSPGTAAGGISQLKIGTSGNSNTVTMDNLSRYNADVSGTLAGSSDGLAVVGALSLGATGTTNALYITPGAGSLQKGYILTAASTGLTGKFNSVYYNNVLVGSPETAGSINGTHNLVYGPTYVMLENPATNNSKYWVNPDCGTVAAAANWSSAPVLNSNDSLIVPMTGGTFSPPSGGTNPVRWTVGEFTAYAGTLLNTYSATTFDPNNNIWRVAADNGLSGNFTVAGTYTKIANSAWNTKVMLDVDGNVNMQPGSWGSVGEGFYVRMRGIPTGNRTYTFASGSSGQCYSLQVDNSVTNLTFVAPSAGYNGVQRLDLNASSSASGAVWVQHLANTQSLFVSPACDVSNLDVSICHSTTPADGAAWVPGRHYGNFIFSNDPSGYWGGADRNETLRIADADMWVKSLTVNPVISGGTNATGTVTFLFDTDNNGITRNLTVDGDALFGKPAASTNRVRAIFKTNSSTVDIGRDLIFYKNGSTNTARHSYLLGGSATIHVGRNFSVDNGSAAIQEGWNPGTSTFIFDGNGGAYNAQSIKSAGGAAFKSVPFYDVQINNPGGTVSLADNLLLKGDLSIVAGTLNPATYYVVLAGGIDCETTAQEIDANGADLVRLHIKAGSNTWAKLIDDLTVGTDLIIDTGCKLFLNGHTLTAEGQTFSGVGTWTWEGQGEIVGTAPIPEPATWLLLGTGLLGVIGYARRRRMN